MVFPVTYYVIPEHLTRLSADRTELTFEQHLPRVRMEDLSVEVLDTSLLLDFRTEGTGPVARCYPLPYPVDPETASAEFRDSVLLVRMRLRQAVGIGRGVEIR